MKPAGRRGTASENHQTLQEQSRRCPTRERLHDKSCMNSDKHFDKASSAEIEPMYLHSPMSRPVCDMYVLTSVTFFADGCVRCGHVGGTTLARKRDGNAPYHLHVLSTSRDSPPEARSLARSLTLASIERHGEAIACNEWRESKSSRYAVLHVGSSVRCVSRIFDPHGRDEKARQIFEQRLTEKEDHIRTLKSHDVRTSYRRVTGRHEEVWQCFWALRIPAEVQEADGIYNAADFAPIVSHPQSC